MVVVKVFGYTLWHNGSCQSILHSQSIFAFQPLQLQLQSMYLTQTLLCTAAYGHSHFPGPALVNSSSCTC